MRALVLLLAACGGGSSPATDGGDPPGDGDAGEATECPPSTTPEEIAIPVGFAVDATHFYFGTTNNLELSRQPIGGGPVEKVADLTGSLAAPIVVGDQHVFGIADGAAFRVAKSGGTPESLGTVDGQVTAIATDGTALYFAAVQSALELRRAAIVNGPTTLLADISTNGIDEAASDGTHLYWTSAQGGIVRRIPVAGGAIEEIADSRIDIAANVTNFGLGFAGGEVLWSAVYQSVPDGRVFAQPKTGGPRRELTHTNLPSGLAVVGDHLYVVLTSSISKIAKLPLAGGPREIIGCVNDRVFSLAAHDHGVYVIEVGTVLRFAP